MLCKLSHPLCKNVSANTRPYQLCWDKQEKQAASYLAVRCLALSLKWVASCLCVQLVHFQNCCCSKGCKPGFVTGGVKSYKISGTYVHICTCTRYIICQIRDSSKVQLAFGTILNTHTHMDTHVHTHSHTRTHKPS